MIKTMMFAAATIAAASISAQAQAGSFMFKLGGSGISGTINLTYAINPNTGVLPGTSPNPVDPIGSYIVTGIAGTFSDANIGISNAAITGIVASNPANPSPTNLLAPNSFGFYPIASGVMTPAGWRQDWSYDNCSTPADRRKPLRTIRFYGGVFDIYGIVFTIAGGNAVNLWSNGDMGGGVNYGIGVTDGLTLLDYTSPVSLAAVPEPASWALLIGGFGLVGAVMRRRRRHSMA